MPHITPTEKATNFWKAGDRVKALRIFKDFKIGVTREQARVMQIAYEMQAGSEAFYTSLGFNKKDMVDQATVLVNQRWINN